MKKNKIRLVTLVSLNLFFVFLIIFPTHILQVQGIGYYDGGLKNSSFETYDSSTKASYWSGYGAKGTLSILDGTYSFLARGATNQLFYMTQVLSTTTVNQLKGETIAFSFWFKGHLENSAFEVAHAEIKYSYTEDDDGGPTIVSDENENTIIYDGSTSQKTGSSIPSFEQTLTAQTTKYVYGDWVTPINSDWYKASASLYVPSTATYIQLRIVGRDTREGGYFNTYLDMSSLDIIYSPTLYSFSSVNAGLSYGINKIVNDGSDDLDGIVSMTAGLTAIAKSNYYLMSTKITISLEPVYTNWLGSKYTTQKGRIDITSTAEGNNLGLNANPEDMQNRMDLGLTIIGTLFDMALGANIQGSGSYFLEGAKVLGLSGSTILGLYVDTNIHDPIADAYNNKYDYSATEKWIYPTTRQIDPLSDHPDNHFVKESGSIVNFKWMVNTNSATSFKIKITYEYEIGTLFYLPFPGNNYYHLLPYLTLSVFKYRTIYL
ncbi:MAG: hypothetical protein ACTSR1_02150 [Candidatus Heimdallarchaeota archaeon]